ncbi:Fic family protein [Pseudomonas chlororaphis]|uniref:Fic family protein n=1 Tax=Pseudomonas chlororaphis TaxID=587753 RepID=UPI002AB0ED34|nr:hypothetical protein [Pseudomonas chlororaphis]
MTAPSLKPLKVCSGRCLSAHCESGRIPLEWQCALEHRWQATLASIKQDRWCPTCCRLGRRDSLALKAGELMQHLQLTHRPTFRNNYLNPALAAGLIEMTDPDSPRSLVQKYRMTAEGAMWMANN